MKKIYIITYETTAGVKAVSLFAHKNRNDAEAAAREVKERDYVQPKSVKIVVLGLK